MDLQIIGFLCEIEITQLWISIIDLYYYSSNSFFFTYSEYSQSSNIWAIRHCTFWQCLIFSLKRLTIITWLLQYMKLQHTHWNIWKYSSQISKQLHCEFCFHVALSSLISRKKGKNFKKRYLQLSFLHLLLNYQKQAHFRRRLACTHTYVV